jgi:hypothetical protein
MDDFTLAAQTKRIPPRPTTRFACGARGVARARKGALKDEFEDLI